MNTCPCEVLAVPFGIQVALRAKRLKSGQTQEQAATKIGCARPVYNSWESKGVTPDKEFGAALAGYLKTTRDLVDVLRDNQDVLNALESKIRSERFRVQKVGG